VKWPGGLVADGAGTNLAFKCSRGPFRRHS
jgi:hypothetical protein